MLRTVIKLGYSSDEIHFNDLTLIFFEIRSKFSLYEKNFQKNCAEKILMAIIFNGNKS